MNENEPVTLIVSFEVPVQESERFLDHWRENARIMARQPGLIRARMHRSVSDDAEARFVNVAEWTSRAAYEAAIAQPEVLASAQRMRADPNLHMRGRPVIYEVAVTVTPEAWE